MAKPPRGVPRVGSKRKKTNEIPFDLSNTGFFPSLAEVESKIREGYVKIESLEPGRPMMALNQYIVRRELNVVTKNWSKFGRTRQGDTF